MSGLGVFFLVLFIRNREFDGKSPLVFVKQIIRDLVASCIVIDIFTSKRWISITVHDGTKLRIICLTKPKDFFHQILNFLWKGHTKRPRGQKINKTVNQPEPYWTKTNQNCYLKPGSLTLRCNTIAQTIISHSAKTGLWISTKDSDGWFLLHLNDVLIIRVIMHPIVLCVVLHTVHRNFQKVQLYAAVNGTLNSPSSWVVNDSTPSRRRILIGIWISGLLNLHLFYFLDMVNLHLNIWSMVNLERTCVLFISLFSSFESESWTRKNKSAWWIFTELYFWGGESWPNHFEKEVNWWWILT